jgi:membrane protein required for beta-lactamase induction
MEELTLITPTFLFSAISLLLLAYTNRFLSYAQLVRTLKDAYLEDHNKVKAAQIENLRRRLYLTRAMQMLGISSLFLCVVTMFLIYVGLQAVAFWVFGLAILLLLVSLGISVREIQISVMALELHLSDMEKPTDNDSNRH